MNLGIKQQRQIRQENELLSKRSKELALAETSLQRLGLILDDARREIQALNEQIPESAEIGEFLKQVDSLMKKRKVMLINLPPLAPVEEKLYTKIPFRLMFRGSFLNSYHLLYDLETMKRTLVIEKVNITKSNASQECRVDLTASIIER